jgi:AraC-like DNA-binding protein
MRGQHTRSSGEGLERYCEDSWLRASRPAGGVELLTARLGREAYRKHRHDTYAVGVTDHGVQVFDYRGATRASTSGEVVVLHPDETHDGRAGTPDGFGYRIVYLDPSLVSDVMRGLGGRAYPLPFLREPVARSPMLSRAIRAVFEAPLEPLDLDAVVVDLVKGLMAGDDATRPRSSPRVDGAAMERARQLLHADSGRVVHSSELEAITGLSRYALCRQFRVVYGTTPHRYLVLRRLDQAREAIERGEALAVVASDVGFADQAHFTRAFVSAFGITPARYRALRRERGPAPPVTGDTR